MKINYTTIELSVLGCVAVSCLWSVFSLKTEVEVIPASSTTATRSIASVNPNVKTTELPKLPIDALSDPDRNGYTPHKVSCGDNALTIETKAPRIRIYGSTCSKVKPEKPGIIQNTSSNYQASVFLDKFKKEYSSDFIPLVPGKNTIEIGFSDENKTKPVKVTVNRID